MSGRTLSDATRGCVYQGGASAGWAEPEQKEQDSHTAQPQVSSSLGDPSPLNTGAHIHIYDM